MNIGVLRAQRDLQHINNHGIQSAQPPKSRKVQNPNLIIKTYFFHYTTFIAHYWMFNVHWDFATCKHSNLRFEGWIILLMFKLQAFFPNQSWNKAILVNHDLGFENQGGSFPRNNHILNFQIQLGVLHYKRLILGFGSQD
jgi:hypothetical protein